MSKKSKILLGTISVLVLIQFIRPEKNNGSAASENDIFNTVKTSEEVKNILIKSCYDCHSNHTDYPWYNNIQPIAFWLAHHVKEGKEELNFSEFKNYSLKKQLHKLEETVEMINENEMPLSSYIIIHKNAKLAASEKQLLINWATEGRRLLQESH